LKMFSCSNNEKKLLSSPRFLASILTFLILSTAVALAAPMFHVPLVKFANAQAIDDRFNVRVSSTYYSPTESIIVYGRSVLGDSIIVRLFDASGIVVRLET